jgi:hypothetical protein
VNQTAKLVGIFASATYPNPGSKALNAGTISGKPSGGAVVQRITITGHPTATTYTLKATGTHFYARRTTRTSFSAVATAQANGALTVTGHVITQAVLAHIVAPGERSRLLEPRRRRPHWWPT